MTTARRAVATILAVTGLVLVAVGPVAAASPEPSPDTIGGKLQAGDHRIVVTSQGTTPVRVTMDAEVVELSETTFLLGPGEEHSLTYTGDHVGGVTAFLESLDVTTAGDRSSLSLVVNLKDYSPPFDWSPVAIGLLGLAAVALLARRYKPWRWRIVTA